MIVYLKFDSIEQAKKVCGNDVEVNETVVGFVVNKISNYSDDIKNKYGYNHLDEKLK